MRIEGRYISCVLKSSGGREEPGAKGNCACLAKLQNKHKNISRIRNLTDARGLMLYFLSNVIKYAEG